MFFKVGPENIIEILYTNVNNLTRSQKLFIQKASKLSSKRQSKNAKFGLSLKLKS